MRPPERKVKPVVPLARRVKQTRNAGLVYGPRMKILVGCALLFALAASAHAEDMAATAERKAFSAGMKHFDLGEYREALEQFKEGYRIQEDPVFLYNIAQSYRALGDDKSALRYYRLYRAREAHAPNGEEVDRKIAALQAAIAEHDKTAPSPTTAAPSPSATSPAPAVAATPSESVARSAAPHATPLYKKWWLWTVVGVVAAGAVTGIAVGATHASSNANWPVARF